jgi:hypothetical protein
VSGDRRTGKDRRSEDDRRKQDLPFEGQEKRKLAEPKPMNPQPTPSGKSTNEQKRYYTTQEVADRLGLSQTTLTLWIRNQVIDDSTIKRDAMGRRLWSEENIKDVMRIKKEEGWK